MFGLRLFMKSEAPAFSTVSRVPERKPGTAAEQALPAFFKKNGRKRRI